METEQKELGSWQNEVKATKPKEPNLFAEAVGSKRPRDDQIDDDDDENDRPDKRRRLDERKREDADLELDPGAGLHAQTRVLRALLRRLADVTAARTLQERERLRLLLQRHQALIGENNDEAYKQNLMLVIGLVIDLLDEVPPRCQRWWQQKVGKRNIKHARPLHALLLYLRTHHAGLFPGVIDRLVAINKLTTLGATRRMRVDLEAAERAAGGPGVSPEPIQELLSLLDRMKTENWTVVQLRHYTRQGASSTPTPAESEPEDQSPPEAAVAAAFLHLPLPASAESAPDASDEPMRERKEDEGTQALETELVRARREREEAQSLAADLRAQLARACHEREEARRLAADLQAQLAELKQQLAATAAAPPPQPQQQPAPHPVKFRVQVGSASGNGPQFGLTLTANSSLALLKRTVGLQLGLDPESLTLQCRRDKSTLPFLVHSAGQLLEGDHVLASGAPAR